MGIAKEAQEQMRQRLDEAAHARVPAGACGGGREVELGAGAAAGGGNFGGGVRPADGSEYA